MSDRMVQFAVPNSEPQHMKDKRKREQMLNNDMELIEKALSSDKEDEVRTIHRQIDAKYQSCISNWGQSMYAHHPEFGFAYHSLSIGAMKDNLMTMKAKLEAFSLGLNIASETEKSAQQDVNVVVNNNIRIDISFEQARQKIEDMEGLTQAETEEIIGKIDELEKISKEPISRKKKWEKIHPILSFVLDKSVDVAIMVFSLFLQMNI